MNAKQISDELITIPAAQFARLLQAAVYCDYLQKQRTICENKICRMRKELTHYQTICENHKTASNASAFGATSITDIEREHFRKLENKYIAVCKERDELLKKVSDK